jgi:hypothetical protein
MVERMCTVQEERKPFYLCLLTREFEKILAVFLYSKKSPIAVKDTSNYEREGTVNILSRMIS